MPNSINIVKKNIKNCMVVEEINFLLDYADASILKVIKIVISTLNLNNCNIEAFNSIKRRIRQKEEELS